MTACSIRNKNRLPAFTPIVLYQSANGKRKATVVVTSFPIALSFSAVPATFRPLTRALPAVLRRAASSQDGALHAGSALSEGCRLENALGRERGSRAASGLCRLHGFRGSHRQAVPQGEVGRGACDQGNFQVFAAKSDSPEGVLATAEEPLDYWANMDHGKVAFVANPESGGMSLTLVEARMAVYWSNSWKPEYRVQSEDRIHRKGMDENLGCTIVDLIHLPSDGRVWSDPRQPEAGANDDGRNPRRRGLEGSRRGRRNVRGGSGGVNCV